MRFGSVCSGIEAASVAWRPLGWECAWVSEIDPHACSVLAARCPDAPNLGNLIGLSERLTDDERAIDLLVGGTPCQGFSVAGQRGGMDDPRSRLAWEFLAIARAARPRWLVWENVLGCMSTRDGQDFGAILGAMAELGYGLAWRILDAQFVRVDSHPRAVPQRRRRVFVVGYLGDWRPSVAVLLEPEGLRGDSPPRREAGQDVAGSLSASLGRRGGQPSCASAQALVAAPPLTGNPYGDHESTETLVAFSAKDHGADAVNGVAPTLRAGQHNGSHANSGAPPAVAFQSRASAHNSLNLSPCAPSLDVGKAGGMAVALAEPILRENSTMHGRGWCDSGAAFTLDTFGAPPVSAGMTVRRLTPTECERLQGFPDGHTAVEHNGKPMADGPRYRLLGNSFPVNVVRWIGDRIALFEKIVGRA